MKVDITYCVQWNYLPQATGLVAELKEAFGDKVQTNLIKGSQGVFDVVVDGERVYAKSETGRFPNYREVPNFIEQKIINA